MKDTKLTELVREAFADVDWSSNWADQIDGRIVGDYVVNVDRSYPNWEGGKYIASLWRDDIAEYDIVDSYGEPTVYPVREREE